MLKRACIFTRGKIAYYFCEKDEIVSQYQYTMMREK